MASSFRIFICFVQYEMASCLVLALKSTWPTIEWTKHNVRWGRSLSYEFHFLSKGYNSYSFEIQNEQSSTIHGYSKIMWKLLIVYLQKKGFGFHSNSNLELEFNFKVSIRFDGFKYGMLRKNYVLFIYEKNLFSGHSEHYMLMDKNANL